MNRTYEECAHQFGMRYLISTDWKDLDSIDLSTLITIDTGVSNCSYDTYDHGTSCCDLTVVLVDGKKVIVEVEGMSIADVMKAVLAEDSQDAPHFDKQVIIQRQAEQIAHLESELRATQDAHRAVSWELKALQYGVSQQTALWDCMRNVHRELDLWFNKNVPEATNPTTVTWDAKVERMA